jgi:fatty acid-binding protein DegV
MIDLAIKSVSDIGASRFVVMHTHAPQLAETARAKLESRFNGARPRMLEILEAGPAIAVHAGPGAVGVFAAQDE